MNRSIGIPTIIGGSWRRTLAIGLWSLVGLCGGIVLLRRIAGTFNRELSGTEYFWVTSAVVLLMMTANLVISEGAQTDQNPHRPRTILTLFVLMIFVAALQPLSGLSGWLISFAAATISCAVAWSPHSCIHLSRRFSREIENWLPEIFPPIPGHSASSLNETSTIHPLHFLPVDDVGNSDVTLELVRRNDSVGISIEGTIRVEFEAGLKQTNIHIPFSPPLESTANATCHCSGDGLDVQLGALFPYGMRLEARRSSAIEPLTSALHFELRVPNS